MVRKYIWLPVRFLLLILKILYFLQYISIIPMFTPFSVRPFQWYFAGCKDRV